MANRVTLQGLDLNVTVLQKNNRDEQR
jgi:hypothetical protein